MRCSLKWMQITSLVLGFGLLSSVAGSAQVSNPKLANLKRTADRVNRLYVRMPERGKNSVSNNALNLVNISNQWLKVETVLKQAASQPRRSSSPTTNDPPGFRTVRVSNPAYDYTLSQVAGFTQSETSTAQCGNRVVVGYNDSGSFLETFTISPSIGLSFNGYAISFDGGKTFIDKGFLNPGSSTDNFLGGDPVVACTNTNTFYQASLFSTSSSSAISVSKSTNGGLNFANPVAAVQKDGFYHFLDKEWLAVDPTNPNRLYVTYTDFDFSGSQFRIAIELVRSTDGGATWSAPVVIAETTTGSVQGSQVLVGKDGEVYVAWQDSSSSSSPKIQMRKSTDNGISFGSPVLVTNVTPIGSSGRLKGGFRVNQFPYLALNRTTGEVYITWNDGRTNNAPDALGGTYNYSDIFFSSSTNQGASWSTPVRVNNNSEPMGSTSLGKDQFFPGIAVDNTGKLAICFYDRRNDPSNLLMHRFCATSTNGGSSWSNRQITRTPFRPVLGADLLINPSYMGDYDTIATDFTRNLPGFIGAYADNTLPTAPDVRAHKFD